MITASSHKLSFGEKVGYSLGDAAANFVWRSSMLLPLFYTDVFGISALQATILILVIRLSDGITDIIMGSIADRTNTSQGKFRPWLLWSTPVLGLFLVLIFTTPDVGQTGKLIYAYLVYFGLTLAYTANNVPYGALMGVMTPSVKERASLASFRFVGAFGGGLLVMGLLPVLTKSLGGNNEALGYQYTMIIFAGLLIAFLITTYFTTQERVTPPPQNHGNFGQEMKDLFVSLPVVLIPVLGVSVLFISLASADWPTEQKLAAAFFAIATFVMSYFLRKRLISRPIETLTNAQKDLSDLLSNKPWLILLGVGILFGLFTVVRPSAAGYYFKYYLERDDLLGVYFAITLLASLFAAIATGELTKRFNKNVLLCWAFVLGAIFSGGIYFVNKDDVILMMALAVVGEFFAGMMPVLFFSMLGDTVDYSEWKNGRRATGLIYSAGTFINKTGHGFAGAIVLLVLSAYGYDASISATIDSSIEGMVLLMSGIPGVIAALGALLVVRYPLNDQKMQKIEAELRARREKTTD